MGTVWIKYVALIVFIVVLSVVGVCIALFGSNACERKECIEKSKYIQANMNFNVSPCTDFFEFACGNYKINVEKPNRMDPNNIYLKKGYSTVLTRIGFDIQNVMTNFISSKLAVSDDRVLKLIKKMYQPCIDAKLVEHQGVKPMWDAIWSIGGVPVVEGDDWSERDFEIGDTEYKTRKAGFIGQHIFQSLIEEDEKNPGDFAIHIKPPEFSVGTPGSELVTNITSGRNTLLNYLSFIVRLTFYLRSTKLGKTYEDESNHELKVHYDKELNKTLDFKLGLFKCLKKYWKDQDPVNQYNRMSLNSLQREFPYVNWKRFFSKMLPTPGKLPKEVVVVGISYFKSIKSLLEATENRTIANYLMIENFIEASLFLPQVFFSIYGKFLFNIINVKGVPRRPVCEKTVKKSLKPAFSSLFVQTYNFTGKGSQRALVNIAETIREEIKNSLGTITWMDDKTKKDAYLKLKQVKFKFSISDEQLLELGDEEARARYYEDLCLGRRLGHVLPSYFCVNKFHLRRNWELLERRPTAFDMDTTTVFDTSFKYDQERNEIHVPYGMLKFPIFNDVWPTYLKYGGVGSILGEVFTRGFDNNGSCFNNLGYKKYWWTEKSKELYQGNVKCFGDEYTKFSYEKSNFTVPNITFVPEYLAHFEGINLASRAYSKYVQKSFLREQSLPGLEQFKPEQLMFIAFANEHCSFYSPLYYKVILQKKKLPILSNYFKVKESLSSLNQFNYAFNCKLGEKMNKIKKCSFLW